MFCPSTIFHTLPVTAIFTLIAALHNIHWSVLIMATKSDSQCAQNAFKLIYALKYGVHCAAFHGLAVILTDSSCA